MFKAKLPTWTYSDPWDMPFAERARMFYAESTRVAYYYTRPDTSSFRFRCYNTSRALNEHVPGVSASWFKQDDADRLLEIVRDATVLVICRVQYNDFAAQLVGHARRFGVRVVYDVDDFVFEPSMVPTIVSTVDAHEGNLERAEPVWDRWFAYTSRMRAMVNLADEVVVTNEYFAERAAESLGRPVGIVSNFMGDEQLAYSRRLVESREEQGNARDRFFNFGYFSGTPTHNRDFRLVVSALAALMEEHDDIRVTIVGFVYLKSSPLRRYTDRVTFSPLTDYMDLQRRIAKVEVNIAPLQDNRFTNCKSELKYFDSAAVGIPTVASPTFTMARAIDDRVTGRLARVDEWHAVLSEVYHEYSETGLAMGAAARAHALGSFTSEQHAPQIAAALGLAAAAEHEREEPQRPPVDAGTSVRG